MSQNLSSNNHNDNTSQPLLEFHSAHGKNVSLSADQSLARRVKSYNNGIAFSARPVQPNETVCILVVQKTTTEFETEFSSLGIGFTSVNPASLYGALPKSGHDLTSQQGFWLRYILDEPSDVGVVYALYYTASGDVILKINGTDYGVFLKGLDAQSSLWTLIDIYGKTVALQFIDPKQGLYNWEGNCTKPSYSLPIELEHAKKLLVGRLYRWRDWLIANHENSHLYIWGNAVTLQFLNDSNGWFRFDLGGERGTVYTTGTWEATGAVNLFLPAFLGMSRTLSEPILPAGTTHTSVLLVFGKWTLSATMREMAIKHSGEKQATVLREDLQGFIFKSATGKEKTFTKKTVLALKKNESDLIRVPSDISDSDSDLYQSAVGSDSDLELRPLERELKLTVNGGQTPWITIPRSLATSMLTEMQDFPQPPPLHFYRDQVFEPLTFHPCIHGANIRMATDSRIAIRFKSYCNGYVMSSRPILPGESCVIQIVQVDSDVVGGLGFGITACNPASLSPDDLPDDAHQLLDRYEYWIFHKHVAGMEPLLGDEIEFHLSDSGVVSLRRNGGDATQLMHVDVSLPLWAVFDVFGSAKAIRLLGTIVQLQEQDLPEPPMLHHYGNQDFQPLTFHPCIHGTNIRMATDSRIAMRFRSYCNGYVMSSRPILPGESCVIQIVQADSDVAGGLGFGMTACNPASLSPDDLPHDADQLLDRNEYWVFFKYVAGVKLAVGDEIEFHLSQSGKVTMKRNGSDPAQLMHVDVSLPLWAVFDVFGRTKAIRLLGTIAQTQMQPSNHECSVCFEGIINCVLLPCKHMNLCYECATTIKNSTGVCPICRARIRDVMQVFHS